MLQPKILLLFCCHNISFSFCINAQCVGFVVTVPDSVETALSEYTACGYRVIALAYKKLPRKFSWVQAQRSQRHEVCLDIKSLKQVFKLSFVV